MKLTLGLYFLLAMAFSVNAVTIDMVSVGNAGNAPDMRYENIPIGYVGYEYQIGKYEVTAGQYTEFLNAVAKSDTNELYNTAMGSPSVVLGANIKRTGSAGNFSYTVAADWADRPVNWVSFWDAARFANWLHNGQPTGPQGAGTTESGAYHDVGNQMLFGRNAGARYFIPTENEWYKAAYHNRTAGLDAVYFDYPAGSNMVPINTLPDPGNHANYYDRYGTGNGGYTIGSPYYRTEVGALANSASPYGTFDQGGNVAEWNETAVGNFTRGNRGGTFDSTLESLQYSHRGAYSPTNEHNGGGFRVASPAGIPEPSTLLLGVMSWFFRSGRRR